MPTPVLAKRPRNETAPAEAETLRFHSGCTAGCFDLLFGTAKNPTRLCREWLRFFRLPEQDCAAFLTNGVVSCMTHDLGKANTGFAGLLKGRQVQTMRHEHVSGLLLSLPELRQWLQRIPGLVFDCVTCAVIGHHLQADRTMFGQPSADMKVFRVLRDGLREVLAPLGPRFSLTEPPMATVPEVWRFDDD